MTTPNSKYKVLAIDTNPKTIKSRVKGLALTGICYLAPSHLSGIADVCHYATDGCRIACLNVAGRGAMNSVQVARVRKTERFFKDSANWYANLDHDIESLKRKAKAIELQAAARLNGTSDIPWERIASARALMEKHSTVQFYDYTKYPYAKRPAESLPSNYHLTYSLGDNSRIPEALECLRNGRNVAVVFRHELPEQWQGFPVIDGTAHDFRPADPVGVVVGLVAKGKAAMLDQSGFIQD